MSFGILINNELEYAQSRYTTDEGQLIVNFDKNIEVNSATDEERQAIENMLNGI